MRKISVDQWMAMQLQMASTTERHDGMTMEVRITTEKCDCCKNRKHGEFIFKPTGAVVCRSCFGE